MKDTLQFKPGAPCTRLVRKNMSSLPGGPGEHFMTEELDLLEQRVTTSTSKAGAA